MADWQSYVAGLHRVGDGSHAYLQPDGSWGLNNTCLLVSHGESLLIDAAVDIRTTRRMLQAMAAAEPAAKKIGTVLLTHWHVDHVHGLSAGELRGSRIIASRTCAEYMANLPPQRWLSVVGALEGDAKRQMDHLLGTKFDFSGLEYVPPTETFEGRLEFTVGERKVIVVEGKPCHTRSDSVVYLPEEGVVHSGDLISAGRHVGVQFPFMSHLVELVEMMLGWNARVYVPGHGPLLDAGDLRDILDYLRFMQGEARKRYDRGLPVEQATEEILANLGPYSKLRGAENLFFTIKMLYCEFAGDTQDHVRRNYPEYLATQWQMRKTVPQKFPELFARF